MRFEIKQILKPLDLGEYHEPYKGQLIQVWVNPTREFLEERLRLLNEVPMRWLNAQSEQPAPDPTPKKGWKGARLAEPKASAAAAAKAMWR